MSAYTGMKSLVGDLVAVAKSLSYPESSICVLGGNEDELKNKFPIVHRNLLSCEHNRDNRTPIEYGQDLVSSWLFEDYLINSLIKNGLDIRKSGTDKKREILSKMSISSSSDCKIHGKGRTTGVEIINDYGGYWNRNRKIDLRDDKYRKISSTSTILLCISNNDNKYMVIDNISKLPVNRIASHAPYGGKPAYSVDISGLEMKDINFKNIAEELNEILYVYWLKDELFYLKSINPKYMTLSNAVSKKNAWMALAKNAIKRNIDNTSKLQKWFESECFKN